MTMTLPQRANRRRRLEAAGKLLLAGTVLAALFSYLPSRDAGPAVSAVGVPVVRTEGLITDAFHGILALVTGKAALVSENLLLRRALNERAGQEALVAALSRELADYRQGFGRTDFPHSIAAAVLAKPFSSPYDTILIDAGNMQGISAGDFVAAPGGILLGVVDAVFPDSSRVILFSAPGQKTSAELSERRVTLSLEGKGGGMMIAFVPRDLPVGEGEVILLPRFRDRALGTVVSVDVSAASSFKTLYVRSPVNINELGVVAVFKASTSTAQSRSKR